MVLNHPRLVRLLRPPTGGTTIQVGPEPQAEVTHGDPGGVGERAFSPLPYFLCRSFLFLHRETLQSAPVLPALGECTKPCSQLSANLLAETHQLQAKPGGKWATDRWEGFRIPTQKEI